MLLQEDMFPIVRIHYDLAHPNGPMASLASFEAQLARAQPLVLIGSGANRQRQDQEERRDIALWMKRHRDALRRLVLALVYVEHDAADRAVALAGADTYEKFWGYPMLVTASDDEALGLATRLLKGQSVGDTTVSSGDVAAIGLCDRAAR